MALLELETEAIYDEDDFEAYLCKTYNAARRAEATRLAEAIATALEKGERSVKAARVAIEAIDAARR